MAPWPLLESVNVGAANTEATAQCAGESLTVVRRPAEGSTAGSAQARTGNLQKETPKDIGWVKVNLVQTLNHGGDAVWSLKPVLQRERSMRRTGMQTIVTQTLVPTGGWAASGLIFPSSLCPRRGCPCK